MDPMSVLLIVISLVLTAVLTLVGIQVVLTLREFRKTLFKLNAELDRVESVVELLGRPMSGIADLVAGVKTGLKITDAFVKWLNRGKTEKDNETD